MNVVFHAFAPELKAVVLVEAVDNVLAAREGRRTREAAERVGTAQFFNVLPQDGGRAMAVYVHIGGSRTEGGGGGEEVNAGGGDGGKGGGEYPL